MISNALYFSASSHWSADSVTNWVLTCPPCIHKQGFRVTSHIEIKNVEVRWLRWPFLHPRQPVQRPGKCWFMYCVACQMIRGGTPSCCKYIRIPVRGIYSRAGNSCSKIPAKVSPVCSPCEMNDPVSWQPVAPRRTLTANWSTRCSWPLFFHTP